MADIFLSYSRKDQKQAVRIAKALENVGFSVWMDISIPAGEEWREVILKALGTSKMTIVLWSHNSTNSEWVKSESTFAADQGKLIPVLISKIEIPLGFSHIQYVDLTNWDGSIESVDFQTLVRAALRFKNQEPTRQDQRSNAPGNRVVVEATRKYKKLSRAPKTQVFLAHASADKSKLKPVVTTMIDQGFRLWIDKPQEIGLDWNYESRITQNRILYGNDWKESIRIAVKKANVVLSFWSQDAVRGRREQFHYEVYLGMMQKKLHQCRIDKVEIDEIGMPYTFDHIADLSEIVTGEYHPELDYLMQDIAKKNSKKGFF